MDDLALTVPNCSSQDFPDLLQEALLILTVSGTPVNSPCALVLLAFSVGCSTYVWSLTRVEIIIKLNPLELLAFLLVPGVAKSQTRGIALQVVTCWQVVQISEVDLV